MRVCWWRFICAFPPPWQVMRRYHIQERDDYKKYNKLVGLVTKLTNVLKQLDGTDKARIELTDQLLDK
jgi:U3 small nucleolar ribonucleoprotein protein IMP3